jgi:uncharacterized SAM-binding protein YcdF (DUF218 family)
MKALAIIIFMIALTTMAIGAYLSPNDLSGCADKPSSAKMCGTADAVVAVSGGDTQARTAEAIKLYQNGWATRLIMSGAAQDKSGPSNAQTMARQAVAAGVPADAIITEDKSETTQQNAEQTQTIFQSYNIKTVILVTSGYHERRASLEFAARSPDVLVRRHPVSSDGQWSGWWWATPQGWFLAVSELVKIGIFYVGGGH